MGFKKGHRPMGGRPKGSKNAVTLQKELDGDSYRAAVRLRLAQLQDVAFEQAMGLSEFYVKDAEGQWQRLTNPDMILMTMQTMEEGKVWRIFTKPPDIAANKYLTDQAIGKPTETQEQKQSGTVTAITKIVHEHVK